MSIFTQDVSSVAGDLKQIFSEAETLNIALFAEKKLISRGTKKHTKEEKKKKQQKAEADENRPLTLSEIAAIARENGMIYGQFVAKMQNK